MTRPSPIIARLFALQISARPEDAQELELLEQVCGQWWHGGEKVYEAKRAAERNHQLISHHRLLVKLEKR